MCHIWVTQSIRHKKGASNHTKKPHCIVLNPTAPGQVHMDCITVTARERRSGITWQLRSSIFSARNVQKSGSLAAISEKRTGNKDAQLTRQ